MVKAGYWDVTDAQVIEKTGQPLVHWMVVLAAFGAKDRPSNDAIAPLQADHGVPATGLARSRPGS